MNSTSVHFGVTIILRCITSNAIADDKSIQQLKYEENESKVTPKIYGMNRTDDSKISLAGLLQRKKYSVKFKARILLRYVTLIEMLEDTH